MKTVYINVNGEITSSTETVLVVGQRKDSLINKCYYELGKQMLRGIFIPGLSNIVKQDLVTSFEKDNPIAFSVILEQLEMVKYKVLGEQPNGSLQIEIPSEYCDWLRNKGKQIYIKIAEVIESRGHVVEISVDNIYKRMLDDIVKNGIKDCKQFVINDNSVTDDSAISVAIKEMMEGIAFLPYEDWRWETSQSSLLTHQRQIINEKDILTKGSNVSSFENDGRQEELAYKDTCQEIIQVNFGTGLAESYKDSASMFYKEEMNMPDSHIEEQANGNLMIKIDDVDFVMVKVTGGVFSMGGTIEQGKDASVAEKPVHDVNLNDYYIGEIVVTQKLWTIIMGDHHSQFKGENRPVTNISYYGCIEFINKLNAITGKNFRIPTEEEWEYAARSGERKSNCKYSGSNNLKEVAWYSINSNRTTHDVRTKLPNMLGIYDMSGNVWEWCSSYYHKYGQKEHGSQMVTRGGCAMSTPNACRTSRRYYSDPEHSSCYLGLRLAI